MRITQKFQLRNNMAGSVDCGNLDLEIMSLSPVLVVEIIYTHTYYIHTNMVR